jgi:hypothetical protein
VTLGTAQWVFDAFTDANNFTAFFFNADDTFGIQFKCGATTKLSKYTHKYFVMFLLGITLLVSGRYNSSYF